MTFTIVDVLVKQFPQASWTLRGFDYADLNWMDSQVDKPTEEYLTAECARMQAEWDSAKYQRQRALEYPDFREYLDGLVKNDQSQIDRYIEQCLAVKAKYPKSE